MANGYFLGLGGDHSEDVVEDIIVVGKTVQDPVVPRLTLCVPGDHCATLGVGGVTVRLFVTGVSTESTAANLLQVVGSLLNTLGHEDRTVIEPVAVVGLLGLGAGEAVGLLLAEGTVGLLVRPGTFGSTTVLLEVRDLGVDFTVGFGVFSLTTPAVDLGLVVEAGLLPSLLLLLFTEARVPEVGEAGLGEVSVDDSEDTPAASQRLEILHCEEINDVGAIIGVYPLQDVEDEVVRLIHLLGHVNYLEIFIGVDHVLCDLDEECLLRDLGGLPVCVGADGELGDSAWVTIFSL